MIRILATRLRPGDVLTSGAVVTSHPVANGKDQVRVQIRYGGDKLTMFTFDRHDALSVKRPQSPAGL